MPAIGYKLVVNDTDVKPTISGSASSTSAMGTNRVSGSNLHCSLMQELFEQMQSNMVVEENSKDRKKLEKKEEAA